MYRSIFIANAEVIEDLRLEHSLIHHLAYDSQWNKNIDNFEIFYRRWTANVTFL